MAFSAAAAASGVSDQVPWRDQVTMAAGGPYITLELPFDGIRDIPTVPISLMEEAFLVAAPRESVPWRPSSLVAVGDAVTQAPSADGQTVAASLLVLSPQSAHAMVQSRGHRG